MSLAPLAAQRLRRPSLPPLVLHLPRRCGREAAGGTSPDPATAREPSPTAGLARKRGSKSLGKDEELGGGKPKPRSLPCPGSPLGPVPRLASAAGLGRAASWPLSRPPSRPLPMPARLAGTCRPPAAAASSAQRCRDTSHVPAPSPPPTLPGRDSSPPGDRRCPAHGEPPERGAAAIACIASHNLLRGRSESPPH